MSFGLDVIYSALRKTTALNTKPSDVDYYIVPLSTQKESLLVANYLRNQGYKVEYEMINKKLGKALDKD